MKVGMNAMNVHTVAYATQGLAQLIIEEGRSADGVAIAYDSRNNSELFAKTAARVLAAANIPAYLFDELRPTPELSFALRELHCVAGINIKDLTVKNCEINTSCQAFRIGGHDILVEDCHIWGPGYYPHRKTVVQGKGVELPREQGRR